MRADLACWCFCDAKGQEQTIRLSVLAALSVRKSCVRLFKAANGALGIERSFQQGFRVPLTPVRGIEVVTAVHMKGAGQAGNRIGDRVYNVVPKECRISL